ncbi:type III secretion protein [Pseudomonas poae]|nr:type III secretion protein [Pseudomonas poae]
MTHESLAWAQWWARPWLGSLHAWPPFDPALSYWKTLFQSQHAAMGAALEIEPCLPIEPPPALLQLVLQHAAQRDLVLALVGGVYHMKSDTPLSQDHQLWCARLSKALVTYPVQTDTEDALQCLRAWVDPKVWQRLRLSFDRSRVLTLERTPRLRDFHDKLDTVWKAAIWRTGTSHTPSGFPRPCAEPHDNASQTHD